MVQFLHFIQLNQSFLQQHLSLHVYVFFPYWSALPIRHIVCLHALLIIIIAALNVLRSDVLPLSLHHVSPSPNQKFQSSIRTPLLSLSQIPSVVLSQALFHLSASNSRSKPEVPGHPHLECKCRREDNTQHGVVLAEEETIRSIQLACVSYT